MKDTKAPSINWVHFSAAQNGNPTLFPDQPPPPFDMNRNLITNRGLFSFPTDSGHLFNYLKDSLVDGSMRGDLVMQYVRLLNVCHNENNVDRRRQTTCERDTEEPHLIGGHLVNVNN